MTCIKVNIFRKLLFFPLGILSFGQNINPVLSEIDSYKSNKIDSIINLNQDKNKLLYLALAPNINYNMIDKSFNIGFSISNLSSYFLTKQRNKIELERLKMQLIENKENTLFLLEKEYETIQDNYDVLKMELENTTLTLEIFNLKKAQYDKNKITLEEWLNVQKNYNDKKIILFARTKNLISRMVFFEKKIKKDCFKNEITFLKNNIP